MHQDLKLILMCELRIFSVDCLLVGPEARHLLLLGPTTMLGYKYWHGTELGKTSCCPLPSALHCHWVKSWITKVGTGQIRHGVSHWPRGIVGVVIVSCQRYSSLWSSTSPPLNLASSQTWPEYRPSLSSSSSPAHLLACLVNLGTRHLKR